MLCGTERKSVLTLPLSIDWGFCNTFGCKNPQKRGYNRFSLGGILADRCLVMWDDNWQILTKFILPNLNWCEIKLVLWSELFWNLGCFLCILNLFERIYIIDKGVVRWESHGISTICSWHVSSCLIFNNDNSVKICHIHSCFPCNKRQCSNSTLNFRL